MIQKISFADSRARAGAVQSKKVQGVYVSKNQSPVVSFAANPTKPISILKKTGSAIKNFFSNPDAKAQITDPYLNKSLSQIYAELKPSSNLFKPKVILKETESGNILEMIHPVDGGMERTIKFDKQGNMTNLTVFHPEPTLSKREFAIANGGQIDIRNYQ